ncbi:hypothetical protein, partial [Escherichia coli]|uniref:hypothetical protein n=1 Tax=Escherichia coli TaxID=562 RepID=UPI001BDBC568
YECSIPVLTKSEETAIIPTKSYIIPPQTKKNGINSGHGTGAAFSCAIQTLMPNIGWSYYYLKYD